MKTNLKDFSLTPLGKVQQRATVASFGSVLWLLVLLLGGAAFEVKAATDCSAVTEIPKTECDALVAFYNSTGGPNWTDSATNNWLVTNTPCSWTGVYCYDDYVKYIFRSNRNLVGTVPDLSALTELDQLSLANNQLEGTLPTTVVLPQLSYLVLYGNHLCGELPDWVGTIEQVYLSHNHFTVPSDPLLSQINQAIEYSSNWEPDWQATQTPCPTPPMLTLRTVGPGKVSSTTPGIDCGTDCSESYAIGTQVTLVAQGEKGSTFIGWAGACSGTGNCQVTVNDVHSVTARFNFDEAGCEVNYYIRFQLAKARQLLDALKTPTAEYYSSKGVLPTNFDSLTDILSDKYTETLSLNNFDDNGDGITDRFYYEATMKTESAGVSSEIAGKHLRLVLNNPTTAPYYYESWELTSLDIPKIYFAGIPDYRTELSEAKTLLGSLKTPAEEYFSSMGVFPTDLHKLTDRLSGEYVANLSIVTNTEDSWAIQATFKTVAEGVSSVMAGKTIKLTYNVNSGTWQLAPGDSDGIPSEIFNGDGSIASPEELTVCQGGTGTGKITATTHYGDSLINCGESCSEGFVKNTPVTLTATPDAGSVFKGWTNPSCGKTFPMKSYADCKAVFEIPTLTVTTVGNGTVTCNGDTCQQTPYPVGDTVNLVATPAEGFSFKDWTGDCGGTNATTTVTMDAAKNCTATFVPVVKPSAMELTLNPTVILTDSQTDTTPLDITLTGSCSGTPSWTATTNTGGYITDLLVTPGSGTSSETVIVSYRKGNNESGPGNAKVTITATCDTATTTKSVYIQ